MHITISSHIIFQGNSVVRLCDSLGFTFVVDISIFMLTQMSHLVKII